MKKELNFIIGYNNLGLENQNWNINYALNQQISKMPPTFAENDLYDKIGNFPNKHNDNYIFYR